MFLNFSVTTDLENFILKAFDRYREAMFALVKQSWAEEDIRGKGDAIYIVSKYQAALLLAVLVRLEVDKNLGKDWSYFVELFDLENLGDKFACINISLEGLNESSISLNNILNDFGLPNAEGDFSAGVDAGIGDMSIEDTFEVEPIASSSITYAIPTEIDMDTEINTLSGCTINI